MLLTPLSYRAKTDDMYNLSVRRSALRLCREILDNLWLLESAYIGKVNGGLYNKKLSFVRQNRQVALIIERFNRILATKNMPSIPAVERKPAKTKNLCAKKLLVIIISDILTLSSVTESGAMLNKFMLCCNCLSKQLLFLYRA